MSQRRSSRELEHRVRLQFLERLEVVPVRRAAVGPELLPVVGREHPVAVALERPAAVAHRVVLALELARQRLVERSVAAVVVVRASAEVEQMQSAQSS
jgi:hypothetical protein